VAARVGFAAYATNATMKQNPSVSVLLIPQLDKTDSFHYPAKLRLLRLRQDRLARQFFFCCHFSA
jgi:hypothetical protein